MKQFGLWVWTLFFALMLGFAGCSGDLKGDLTSIEEINKYNDLPVLATDLAAGDYHDFQTVALSSSEPNAQIYYTLDGTDPKCKVSSLYTGSIAVKQSLELRALSCLDGYGDSPVFKASYQLYAGPPVFTPGSGDYAAGQSVTVTTATPGAAIYYTMDGTEPECGSSLVYSSAIGVNVNTTVKAIACRSDLPASPIAQAKYNIGVGVQYQISGTISGLTQAGLSLTNSATGETLVAVALGSTGFLFANKVNNNTAYEITVSSQPTGQTCSVANGTGTIASADVTNVAISCATNQYSVAITNVSGLVGADSVKAVLDATDTSPNLTNGSSHTFATNVAYNSTYEVTLDTASLPAGGYSGCVLSPSGTQTMGAANATATIACTPQSYQISGTISGLTGNGLVLTNSATGENLGPIASGSVAFNFANNVAYGTGYNVSVTTQPSGQTCTVSSGSGTMPPNNVTNVAISCAAAQYQVGGTVSGLPVGGTLNVSNNTTDTQLLNVNGAYSFLEDDGDGYNIALDSYNAPGYTCSLSGTLSGTISGANVTGIDITCTPDTYTLTVSISDLANAEVLSVLNDGETLSITGDGTSPKTGSFAVAMNINDPYSVTITSQPAGKVCAFTDTAYGNMPASNVSLDIQCVSGYPISGRVQAIPAAPLSSFLLQGNVSPVAGSGTAGNADGSGAGATFNFPVGLASNGSDLYVADTQGHRIRQIDTGGNVTTFAGDGSAASTDGTGTGASLHSPRFLTTDGGNLYVTEYLGHCIRRIVLSSSEVTTVAGTCGTSGNDGGDVDAASARFDSPSGIVYHNNALYVADRMNHKIRKMDLATGVVSILAGSTSGHLDGIGGAAQFNEPEGLAIINDVLYVSEYMGNVVRAIDLGTANVTTLLGNGTGGFQDGPISTSKAFINGPSGLTTDGTYLYLADSINERIRKIDLRTQTISTLAGNGITGAANGIGIQVSFQKPMGIICSGKKIFVADNEGHQIRQLMDNGLIAHYPLLGNALDYAAHSAFPTANGSWTGSPSYGNGRFNKPGGAADFDGSSYISTKDISFNHTDSFTISAWVYKTTTSDSVVYGKENYESVFQLSADGRVMFLNWDTAAATKFYVTTATNMVPLNQWIHILYVFQKEKHSATYGGDIYINGKLATRITGDQKPADSVRDLTENDRIGHGWNNYYFTGRIADLRVYNRALNDGEINELAQMADPAQVGSSYSNGATGLLSHYSFDNNAGIPSLNDNGPLDRTLTVQGGALNVIGKDGDSAGAYALSGSSQNLENASQAGLPMQASPRTVCAWANPTKYPTSGTTFTMVSYGSPVSDQMFSIAMKHDSGTNKQYLILMKYGAPVYNSEIAIPLNTWSHICGVYDGANASIFWNGKLLGISAWTIDTQAAANPFFIGRSSSVGSYFPGKIDDVRIYNNALTSDQIRQLALQVPAGLVARYDFTDNTNANDPVKDVSGFGLHGTAMGSLNPASGRTGIEKTALLFDGTTSYIDITTAPHLPRGDSDRTLCAWFKPADNGIYNIISYGTMAADQANGLAMNASEVMYYGFANDTSGNHNNIGNRWIHFCGTYNGNVAEMYMNGMNIGSETKAWNTVLSVFNIGRRGDNAELFQGAIDDVRIYGKVLTQNEILALSGFHPMQVSTWSKAPASSSMRVHYTAESLTLADTGPVGNLPDISGNGINLEQATATNQPEFRSSVADIIGRHPVIRFDGTDDFLVNNSAGSVHSVTHSVVSVIKFDPTPNVKNPILNIGDQLHLIDNSNVYYISKISTGDLGVSNNQFAFDTEYIAFGGYDATGTASFYVSGKDESSASAMFTTTSSADLQVGLGDGSYFKGNMAELMYFNKTLVEANALYAGFTDREIVHCYLSARYNIGIDHACP